MRQDQVNLKKEFEWMRRYIDVLERSINQEEDEIKGLKEQVKDWQQRFLILRIEHNRMMCRKPALTISSLLLQSLLK